MTDLLREPTPSFFRRAAFELDLKMTSQEIVDEKATFTVETSSDRFLVFRAPAKITIGFVLTSRDMPTDAGLKNLDRLTAYFFDHKSIAPILPIAFQRHLPLYERMSNQRAEIKPTRVPPEYVREGFSFAFDYTALYHSGNPLREEQRAKQRIIDYSNDHEKRSVL